jgi:urate oxidase
MDLKKTIILPEPCKKVNIVKEKKIRVVTNGDNWNCDYDPNIQLQLLTTDSSNNPIYKTMMQQIQSKLNGYKSQDLAKDLYMSNEIIGLQSTIDLLIACQLKCYYCKETTKVLYEHVREPKQWTLERIDNSIGHNIGNVEIACLSCNLRRRTMYHERFLFTKQLTVVKSGNRRFPEPLPQGETEVPLSPPFR